MRIELVRHSRLLSRVLRHAPRSIGLELDPQGWIDVDALLLRMQGSGAVIDRSMLDEIVATNDKQRFAFDDERRRIRANQGHSIDVDLGLDPAEPPERLYHGTATRFLKSIDRQGLRPGRRRFVHLSADVLTARQVGSRHGLPAVLAVQAREMHVAGHVFNCAANGVWLVDRVPARYVGRLHADSIAATRASAN